MELLGLTLETPMEIRTNGKSIIETPVSKPTSERMALFLKAKEIAERKLASVLGNLAK